MGTVTIVNGTNTLINASTSAAVNYDWFNKIRPNEYVVLDGGTGLVTLHARYWAGEESEYEGSAVEIGLFVAGTVIAVLGVVLAAVTFGGSLVIAGVAEATLASMIFGAAMTGAAGVLGLSGIGIGAIIIAAKDFAKTPTSHPGIYAPHDRKFIVEGRMTGNVNEHHVLTIEGAEHLRLRELKLNRAEFEAMARDEGLVEHRKNPAEIMPVGNTYVSADDLKKSGLLGAPTWIYPTFSGVPGVKPSRWEFLHDRKAPGTPLQLWNREAKEILWEIQFVGNFPTVVPGTTIGKADSFALYNRTVGGYASLSDDAYGPLVLEELSGRAAFFMVKAANSFSFVPIGQPAKVVATEKGQTGNGTRVVLADRHSPHPGWARWVVDPILLSGPRPTREALDAAELLYGPVRIYTAVSLRSHQENDPKPACWEIDRDATNLDASIQMSGRDVPKVDWKILSMGKRGDDEFFAFYNESLNRYAKVSASESVPHVRATNASDETLVDTLFFIVHSMGYLSFFPVSLPGHAIYAEGTNIGARLRAAKPGETDLSPALARWVVVPQVAGPA